MKKKDWLANVEGWIKKGMSPDAAILKAKSIYPELRASDEKIIKKYSHLINKEAKPVFDFKAEALDEKEIDKILLISRSDGCVFQMPSIELDEEEWIIKARKDLCNIFISSNNGKLWPYLIIEPSSKDIPFLKKWCQAELITSKYRNNLQQESSKQKIDSNKKGNSNQKKKSREKGTQYDDTIRSLSKLITNLKKTGLSSELIDQCIKEREHFQGLQKEARHDNNPKILLKNPLKINQLIDQQIYDLCKYVKENRRGITLVKCFRLVAQIMTAKGRIGIDFQKVKTAYWNLF
jgi:gas vesicle protein